PRRRSAPSLSSPARRSRRSTRVPDRAWPRVAVMGAGAIGCFFGGMLARAVAPVVLIARQRHVDSILRDGLRLERDDATDFVRIDATTDPAGAAGADLVLVSVKAPDTAAAGRDLAPHVGP